MFSFTGQFGRVILIIAAVSAVLLVSCEASVKAPVSQLNITPIEEPEPITTYTGRTTIVVPGDNLYSISFMAGFNHYDVAAWNDMNVDDILHVGRELKLYPPKKTTVAAKTEEVAKASKIEPASNAEPELATSANSNIATTAAKKPEANEKAKSNQTKTPKIAIPVPVPKVPTGNNSDTKVVSAATVTPTSKAGWIWPARGKLISTFSTKQRRNGIQIAGQSGTTIRVVADGRVVYSGTGLIGYGRIIIIEHDQQLLSVYAHNSRVVVKEGDAVKRGQKIAEMGNTDSDRVKLHFEVRRNGKPVNPLEFLPKA